MEEVKNWFKNKDYEEGVTIYCRIGSDSFLKTIFQSGETPYTKQKLIDELSSLLPEPKQKGQHPHLSDAVDQLIIDGSIQIEKPLSKQQTSVHYLKLCRRRDELNRQISRNMVLLDETRSKARRHETAKQILSLDRKKREVWAEIDYFNEHGSIMPVAVKKEPVTDEIQRLYVQIYKAEKRLKKTELRNREKTEKLLNEKRARLTLLKAERSLD